MNNKNELKLTDSTENIANPQEISNDQTTYAENTDNSTNKSVSINLGGFI